MKVINRNTSRGQGVTGDRDSVRRLCKTREPMNKNLIQPERCGDSLPESCKMQATPTRWGELAQHSSAWGKCGHRPQRGAHAPRVSWRAPPPSTCQDRRSRTSAPSFQGCAPCFTSRPLLLSSCWADAFRRFLPWLKSQSCEDQLAASRNGGKSSARRERRHAGRVCSPWITPAGCARKWRILR